MQAPETIEMVDASEKSVRGACLNAGCACKNPRIVSRRRAAFFAAMAQRSGQTADRFVPVEVDWRIPFEQVNEFERPRRSDCGDEVELALESAQTAGASEDLSSGSSARCDTRRCRVPRRQPTGAQIFIGGFPLNDPAVGQARQTEPAAVKRRRERWTDRNSASRSAGV
jgi:hypothetical protein